MYTSLQFKHVGGEVFVGHRASDSDAAVSVEQAVHMFVCGEDFCSDVNIEKHGVIQYTHGNAMSGYVAMTTEMILEEALVETIDATGELAECVHVVDVDADVVFAERDVAEDLDEADAVLELVVSYDGANPDLAGEGSDDGAVGAGKVGQECCEFVLHKRSPFCECMERFRTRMC